MKVSILIPTCNGAETLRELLAVLKFQTITPLEILVVDSSSTDDTVLVASQHGARVVVIPREEFDHGATRTMMARQAEGDYLVFFTQDAIPTTRYALERLLAPLLADATVACSYGRQLPEKNASYTAARLRAFNYPDRSEIRAYEDRHALGIATMFTSNSFAAYRKSCLSEVGYFKNGLIFGEDTCTVGRLLQAGWRVAYVSEATVFHSHEYTLLEELQRSFDIGVLHTLEASLFADFGKAESRGRMFVQSTLAELAGSRRFLELGDFLLRVLVRYGGYLLGKRHAMLPKPMLPLLSLHASWWSRNH